MKQYEAVILGLERLGGQSTLAMLYQETMRFKDCSWNTKTPFASIRRIVQTRPEFFRVRPGLWALKSMKAALALSEYSREKPLAMESGEQSHAYYQGLLLEIGNRRGYATFIPNQDKNHFFVNTQLKNMRSLDTLPIFSHEKLVKRSSTIDVIWFNQRLMPDSLFEVEHSTDIQNSLLKFHDLQDFYARMVIVADAHRHAEYKHKLSLTAIRIIKNRINFLSYDSLVRQYEEEIFRSGQEFLV